MDLATLGFLAVVMFGLIAGDAAINASTMAVSVGLPPKVTSAGLTPHAAEEIFVSELSRVLDTPSGVPVPVPRIASRKTVIGAIAESMRMQDLTGAMQDLFGLSPIRVSATMMERGPGLGMEIVLSGDGRRMARLTVAREDGDAVSLVRTAAVAAFEQIAPFRVTLARLRDGLEGDGSSLRQTRADAERLLRRHWEPGQEVERSALYSLLSVLALAENDLAAATQAVQRASEAPNVVASARAFYALNGAFLAIAQGDLEAARRHAARGEELAVRHPIPSFGSYVATVWALIDWAEGRVERARERLEDAARHDPANRTLALYQLRLGAAPTGALAFSMPSPLIPGLMASVFMLDPTTGEVLRRP